MYKPVQKKSSSWTPASSQSKSKSLTKPGTFSVQPKSESKSSQQQEIPDYSIQAADALAANVMRSLETPQQDQEEAKSVQRQLNLGAAFVVDGVTPIAQSPTPSIQSKEVGIQRQCSECAKEQQEQSAQEGKDSDEMSVGAGAIQTKLTVGAPGDKYEQEADQVAAQVMSMSVAPDSSPQVQRFGEEDNPVQRWSLAQSITPVVQRQVDEQVQMRQLVQRAFQTGGNQASGDLESRLNASKGGGSALAPEVRAFMEPRFGADFSSVRVHTGGEAVQMNRELGAQAFAHGSDVYFGAGKSPGNNELTAHELTHVVQQTGSYTNSSIQRECGVDESCMEEPNASYPPEVLKGEVQYPEQSYTPASEEPKASYPDQSSWLLDSLLHGTKVVSPAPFKNAAVRKISPEVASLFDPVHWGMGPSDLNAVLSPAEHALNQHVGGPSPYLSASANPKGAPNITGKPYWIDPALAKNAGAEFISNPELVKDMDRLVAQNPSFQARADMWKQAQAAGELEVLFKGNVPPQAIESQGMRTIKGLGRGAGYLGAAMTAYDLGNATKQSIEQKSPKPIAAETVRQVGGWGGAWAGAQGGAALGGLLGIETGPGAILTGLVGGLIGGIGGYLGADWVADKIHEN
jgi:hypothetical protein